MLEVPGMTRPALDAMTPDDVEALRWALYVRALRPSITADFDVQIQDLHDIDSPPSDGTMRSRRATRREELTQAKIAQAELRRLLLIDDEGAA